MHSLSQCHLQFAEHLWINNFLHYYTYYKLTASLNLWLYPATTFIILCTYNVIVELDMVLMFIVIIKVIILASPTDHMHKTCNQEEKFVYGKEDVWFMLTLTGALHICMLQKI